MAAAAPEGSIPKAQRTGDLVTIDGAYGEGGGQILRNAVALSCIAGVPVRIHSIRANRPKGGGLRPQHSSSITLLSEIGDAHTEGNEVGSTLVSCYPKKTLWSGSTSEGTEGDVEVFRSEPGTAASTTLIAQASVPLLILLPFSSNRKKAFMLTATGGTNQTMAPPYESFDKALFPLLQRHLGIAIQSKLKKRGLVPSGGGIIELTVHRDEQLSHPPSKWELNLVNRGLVTKVTAYLWQTNMNREQEWEAIKTETTRALQMLGEFHAQTSVEEVRTPPAGKEQAIGVVFVAETDTGCFLSSDGIYERPRKCKHGSGLCENARKMVQDTIETLLLDLRLGACVDSHIQDQLIIFMALSGKSCQMLCGEVTQHTRSAMYVTTNILGARFEIKSSKEVLGESSPVSEQCNVIHSYPISS